MTIETVRLRCVRCGDWHEREVGDPYLPELCARCLSRMLEHANQYSDYAGALIRYVDRFRRGTGRHPTVLALKAVWERLFPPSHRTDSDMPF